MDYFKEIRAQFPVRQSAEQKEAFRVWLEGVCTENGYALLREINGRLKHVQLLAGDPEHAAVLFTCHYDTPAKGLLPDISFGQNAAAFALWTLAQVLLMMIPAALAFLLAAGLTGSSRAALGAFVAVYLAELLLTRFGPARRRNIPQDAALAATLMLMERLPEKARRHTAFLFLDSGERGWQGAKSWCKANQMAAYTRLTVDIGPLGLGPRLLCVESGLARKCTGYQTLRRAIGENGVLEASFAPSKASFLRGEDRAFKCGIGLYSCRRVSVLGDIARTGAALPETEAERQADAVSAALAAAVQKLAGLPGEA